MAKEKDNAEWMQKLWRPAMGWMYMLVCFCDMIVFPVLWALWQGINHVPITQWNPLSLQGAGLFHIAMGAVLGISAFGRTQEKLAGTAANPSATSQTMTTNTNMSGVPAGMAGGMNSGMGGGFGGSTGGFGGSTGGFGGSTGGFGSGSTTAPTTGFSGGAPAFGSAPTGGFGSSSGGFGSTTPTAPTTSGFGGGGFGSTPTATTPAVSSTGKKVVPTFDQPAL
jgi:hypothetical protein